MFSTNFSEKLERGIILTGWGAYTQATRRFRACFLISLYEYVHFDPVNYCSYFFLFTTREGKSTNEERALAYANKVYRTMKAEPVAKSSVDTRRIRDVFFEKR